MLKKSAGSKHELSVAINSPGGNLAEAIQIGMAIREMRLATMMGAPLEIAKGMAGNHCMSACLFILAGGITRDIAAPDFSRVKVGIHRPSFDASYYARLSVTEAERKFKTLEWVSRQYLVDMGISESFVRRMFAIPSTEMKLLDEESFRIEFGHPPFYQEWMIAKCGRPLNHAEKGEIAQYALAIAQEQRPPVSPAYAQKLTIKDKDYRACYRSIRLADQVDSMQKYLNHL